MRMQGVIPQQPTVTRYCEAEPVCVLCVAQESSHTCLVTEVLSVFMAQPAQAVRLRVLCCVPECLTPLSAGVQPDSRLHDACLQLDRGPDHHSYHSTGGLQRHPGRGRKLRYKHGLPLALLVLLPPLSTLRRAAHRGQSRLPLIWIYILYLPPMVTQVLLSSGSSRVLGSSCCRVDCSTYGMLPDAWRLLI